jgi:DNA-binding MarR family transcriptional regulator
MGTGNIEDLSSFVRSSKYRVHVLENLARVSPATPTELAENTEYRRSHISRAVSELRERDVVELRVSEERTVGRSYGLTATGRRLWETLESELNDVSWTVEAPTTETDRAIVDIVHGRLGDALRFVGKFDGEHASILYAAPNAVSEYSEDELDAGIREFVYRRINMDLNVPKRRCWAQTCFFESEAILLVRPDDDTLFSATFETDEAIHVSSLAKSVRSALDD